MPKGQPIDKKGRIIATVFTPEIAEKILHTLENETPFLSLAAEANGVNRSTVKSWMTRGEDPGSPFEDFCTRARAIRARAMIKLHNDLQKTEFKDKEAAKHKAWLLERIDRDLFNPPRQVEERISEGRGRDKAPRQAATPPSQAELQDAVQELEQPEPDQLN